MQNKLSYEWMLVAFSSATMFFFFSVIMDLGNSGLLGTLEKDLFTRWGYLGPGWFMVKMPEIKVFKFQSEDFKEPTGAKTRILICAKVA